MSSSDPAFVVNKDKDYYEILNIPFSDTATGGRPPVVSKQQLKNAYHKALLKYHPDKAAAAGSSDSTTAGGNSTFPVLPPPPKTTVYTIDDITDAYKVLSDTGLRAEYDRELILRRTSRSGIAEKNKNTGDVSFHTGLEVVDLEDMVYQDDLNNEGNEDDPSSYWYRSCRCGDEKGFIVTEDELEAEAQHGEILVGCRGCSLWIKVLFAVAEEDEEADIDSVGHSMGGS